MEKSFSDALKRQRGALSQAQMAARLGVAQPQYATWESGERMPRADRIRRIAQSLGISESVLFGSEEADPLPWPNDQARQRAENLSAAAGMSTLQFAVECVQQFGELAVAKIREQNARARALNELPGGVAERIGEIALASQETADATSQGLGREHPQSPIVPAPSGNRPKPTPDVPPESGKPRNAPAKVHNK